MEDIRAGMMLWGREGRGESLIGEASTELEGHAVHAPSL